MQNRRKKISFTKDTVNDQDKQGRTLLHKAITINNFAGVNLLLEHGADIEIKDNDGISPADLIKNKRGLLWKKLTSEPSAWRSMPKIHDLLEKIQKQEKKAQTIVSSAGITNKDTIAIQLYKIFNKYAYPELFSFNWHHGENQKVSGKMSSELKKNPDWSWDECKKYIDQAILNSKISIRPLGTFAGLLSEIENLKPEVEKASVLENKK